MATPTSSRKKSASRRSANRRLVGTAVAVVVVVALAWIGYRFMGSGRASAPSSGLAVEPGAGKGFNVVLITLDTTRADRIGCYGYETAETPNLDALAAGGVRVADAVSCVPLTLPAHAALLTGRYPPNNGVRDNGLYRLGEQHETLAERLAARGYATAAFVGAFILDRRYGLNQGFATYDDDITLKYRSPGVRLASPERPADVVVDAALRWLDGHHRVNPDVPFFLWLHLSDPRAPHSPPEPFRERFSGRQYDGEIAFADQQLGRLFDRLRMLGSSDRSLIVAVGNHGESLDEHHEPTHGLLVYESAMQVPLILHAPAALPAGTVLDDRVVSIVDIVPTVLDLLGEPATDLDGASLLRAPDPDRAVYMETLGPRLNHGWSALYALRTHHDKYIKAPTPEYYDLRADPGETANRIEAHASRANELSDRLESILAGFASATTAVPAVAPDSETLAILTTLGYVGTRANAEDTISPRPDPKDEVAEWCVQFARSAELIDRGQFPEAIAHIQGLLRKNPCDAQLWDHLATAYASSGLIEPALKSRKKTIELQPENVNHWIQMAHLQRALKNTEAVQVALTRAVAIQPRHGDIWLLRAGLADEVGDFERAILLCQEARRRDPTRHTAKSWAAIGIILDQLKRPVDAKAAYERAYLTDPLDSGALLGLARVAAREGRASRAVEVANRILPGEIQWFGSRSLLALAYLDLGEAENAVRTMTEMIAALPGQAAPHSNLGNVYLQLGRTDEAVKAYETALKLDPRYANGHYNLGNALEQLGRIDEAMGHYRTAAEINPRLRAPQIAIARLDTKAGRFAEVFGRFDTLLSGGVLTLKSIEANPVFAPLLRDPRFKQLERYRKPVIP